MLWNLLQFLATLKKALILETAFRFWASCMVVRTYVSQCPDKWHNPAYTVYYVHDAYAYLCFLCILLSAYYFVSALGPAYSRYLYWKKYLTMVQMVQFVLAIIMGLNALRVSCDFPLWMQYAMILYMISFLMLFSNFYKKAYLPSERKRKTA